MNLALALLQIGILEARIVARLTSGLTGANKQRVVKTKGFHEIAGKKDEIGDLVSSQTKVSEMPEGATVIHTTFKSF